MAEFFVVLFVAVLAFILGYAGAMLLELLKGD